MVQTNVHYATDSSLSADGVRLLARLMHRVKRAGMATGELVRDFRRSAKRQLLNIIKFSKGTSQTAEQAFNKCYRHLLAITKQALSNARMLKWTIVNRALGLGAKATKLAHHVKKQWDHYLPLIEKAVYQSERRICHGQ